MAVRGGDPVSPAHSPTMLWGEIATQHFLFSVLFSDKKWISYLFIYLFCYKSPRPKTSSISSVFYFVIYDGLILSTSGCRCDT